MDTDEEKIKSEIEGPMVESRLKGLLGVFRCKEAEPYLIYRERSWKLKGNTRIMREKNNLVQKRELASGKNACTSGSNAEALLGKASTLKELTVGDFSHFLLTIRLMIVGHTIWLTRAH